MTHIPDTLLDARANSEIARLRAQRGEARRAYNQRIGELDAEAAKIVEACPHMIVLVSEDDSDERVCVDCGAYSAYDHEVLQDDDDRATIFVPGELVERVKRFELADQTLVR